MNRYQTQRGQALPIMVFLIVALLGFAALAVDAGYWRYDQRIQQTAADSAAMAGAVEVAYNASDVTTAAQNAAGSNGFTNNSNGVTVTVNNPPTSGSYTTNGTAVEVIVTQQSKTFFANVFRNFSSVTTGARAVAARTKNNDGCFFETNASANISLAGAPISAAGCALNMNGTFSGAGETITSAATNYAGGTPSCAGCTLTPPATKIPHFSDPCPEITGCEYLTNNPPPVSGCTTVSQAGNSKTMTPGCYSNISLAGVNTTFDSGLYVITGPVSVSGNSITGSNVTFYITGSGSISMAGASVTLSPPSSGNWSEYGSGEGSVLFYQPSTATGSVSLAGTTQTLSGLIYLGGSGSLSYAGGGSGYAVVVTGANSVSLAGSSVNFASPPPGGALIKNATLVE